VGVGILVLSFLVAGCAGARAPAGAPDAGAADGDPGGLDAGPGGFWESCDVPGDCGAGTCYHPTPGAPGHCTVLCDGDCPDGYECKTVHVSETIEADLCVPAEETFCDSCQENSDCGDSSDACVLLSGGRFCSIDCRQDPTVCPTGFTCRKLDNLGDDDVWQCVPLSGLCCIDRDGDLRGEGGGCLGGDCDETNPKAYDDAAEVCDGFDNDCVGGIDVDPKDCSHADCKLGPFGYIETPADLCQGAQGCLDRPTIDCGLYTCDGGGELGDHCASACDGENDGKCIPTAHCDGSACFGDLPSGDACNEDSDCQSSHCQNGFCCASGDCCKVVSDCPTAGANAPVCNDSATCQGEAGQVLCSPTNQCVVQNGVANDSACDGSVVANDCGFYAEKRCSGAANQAPPACPSTCTSNADCDANAYCDPVSDTCRGDLDDGQACPQGAPSCKAGHCQNGFCCGSGDCCFAETDCPAGYSRPATCDTPGACQGTADVAQCLDHRCVKMVGVPDDSACDGPAKDCGPYPTVSCTGAANQPDPSCPTSCQTSANCDPGAYCNDSGACVPDEPNGESCSENGDCQSDHCDHGVCCSGGHCCAGAADCDDLDAPAVCDAQTTCQGSKVEGLCTGSFTCTTTTVDNDSACAGIVANDCGPYPAVSCNGMPVQSPDQAGLCPTACTSDSGCDVSAHCDGASGQCAPDQGPGGFCSTQNECGSGLFCVDNVCCTSACTGSCMACDLPGAVGTCSAVPAGQDPDAECGAVSCVGFFKGWTGDACHRKADVSAAQASCSGGGACRTQAQECGAQTVTGPATLTCQAACQDPNLASCSGTAAGVCTNVNPGSHTCGEGVCKVTVPQCVGGAPNACVPNSGAAHTETCNDIDDNCDGVPDNGAFADGQEQNDSCNSVRTLTQVGSGGTIKLETATLFPSGDSDYYKIPARETDSSCACCDFFCTDEDYRLTVTLTVPSGAGAYQFCTASSCGSITSNCTSVAAGASSSWVYELDGGCSPGGSDSYDVFVRVTAQASPGFECTPYVLTYKFESGVCF
jgi:hypothetical protein